ncbi:AAA family ATPase [Parasedimentitalea maritima]|uniref:AAA family ATPase n=1 Tax=Parasedimentitalea maritima TaxID=2578117 RepID=UPI001BB26913|nr:AAA family ATPase [Zongyanglinia marina]
MVNKFILISGCSGGGKSSVVSELGSKGYKTVEEPGRRIVQEELAKGGRALPWVDAAAFAYRAIDMARADLTLVSESSGFTFFDRGLVDAAIALESCSGLKAKETLGKFRQYNQQVFLVPPWPEIYVCDAERRHGYDDAVEEFERIRAALPALGYDVNLLPKVGIGARADFIISTLRTSQVLQE